MLRLGVRRTAAFSHALPCAGARALTSDGYLHKTRIPTMHFQKSLPRMPLPKLEDTLRRYLDSASVMVPPDAFNRTREVVAAFGAGEGAALHAELGTLRDTVWKDTSYISEMWYDKYLVDRSPLPINVNAFLTWKDDPNPLKNAQPSRAASLITASAAFHRTMRDGHLRPDVFHTKPHLSQTALFDMVVRLIPPQLSWYAGYLCGAYALDMHQYARLFASTRIPKHGKDALVSFEGSRHVVVQRGSDFYKFDVIAEDGSLVPQAQIEANVRAVMDAAPSNVPAIGLLTSQERDTWASARAHIESLSARNAESLRAVDSALFVVCLDTSSPDGLVADTRTTLHGSGRDRWFDKSFQLVVAANGRSAVNFEHAWGDGAAVLRYFDEVFTCANSLPVMPPRDSPAAMPRARVERVDFDIDGATTSAINAAAARFDAHCAEVEFVPLETDVVSGKLMKKHGVGGDGAMQMAFQLAHFRMYGHSASTYESKSHAGFKHGRTETIRSATPVSDAMCRAFCNPATTKSERAAKLREAVTNHARLSYEALLGQGWDRHMFALRKLAERRGGAVPDVFTDEAYKKLDDIILSTSTLVHPALHGGGFGPPGRKCYGIMYTLTPDVARCGVASYHRDTATFVKHLEQSFVQFRDVLGA